MSCLIQGIFLGFSSSIWPRLDWKYVRMRENLSVSPHSVFPNLEEEFLLVRYPGMQLRTIVDQGAPDEEPDEAEHTEEIED